MIKINISKNGKEYEKTIKIINKHNVQYHPLNNCVIIYGPIKVEEFMFLKWHFYFNGIDYKEIIVK